jgi:hypothetical protein
MSSRAILGPGVSTPVVLAAAAAASRSRCRRANASNGVSPARMNNVARSNGVFAGDKCAAGTAAGVFSAETVGVGSGVGVVADAGARATGITSVDRLNRILRRRIGLDPSSRLSHRRNASGEISTPRPRNALASTSTESPSRRSRSSSSRCGSSCAVVGCFGWRAFATNSASVGGGVGVMLWCASGSEGVMWARYSERLRCAMGVGLDQSKPRGLDVGVLTHAFLLFFVISFSSLTLLLQFNVWIRRVAEDFQFRFDERIQSLSLRRFVFVHFDERIKVLIPDWSCAISVSLSSFGLIGGGSC